MLRANEAGNSRTRGWSHCSGRYLPSWKMRHRYCLCPSSYMLLGKFLQPIFSQVVVDFRFAFSECPIRKCPSDSAVSSVKCWVLQLETVGCCAFSIWSIYIKCYKSKYCKKWIEDILILAFKISEWLWSGYFFILSVGFFYTPLFHNIFR